MDAGREMIVTALGDRLAPGVDNFSDMFRDDRVLETPFDGDGTTSPVEGKPNIRAMLRGLEGVIFLENLQLKAVHQTTNDDTVIHEYDGVVRNERTGQRFSRSYKALAVVREGRLALLRERGGPLVPLA
jgi:ketosteroid isomerase-like protein